MMHKSTLNQIVCLLGLLLGIAALTVSKAIAVEGAAGVENMALVQISQSPGMNLQMVEQVSTNYIIVKVSPAIHNVCAGTFLHLPTDHVMNIGLSMAGTPGNVSKWQGLLPEMTYGDPAVYETYEWFRKDGQGRWVSGDVLKRAKARYAGNGTVPSQTAMPLAVASKYLMDNGTYWSCWKEVDVAEAVPAYNVFRIKQKFDLENATIASRVPYTYRFQQQFLDRLQQSQMPGVAVETIGTTPGGRKLSVIRIDDANSRVPRRERPTILITAREHATEPASSWVAHGLACALLAQTAEAAALRKDKTWLIVTILDPDGSDAGILNHLTSKFAEGNKNPPSEVQDYQRYLSTYVATTGTIDLAVSLHNVEANESAHAFVPVIDPQYQTQVVAVNSRFFTALQAQGYLTGTPDQAWEYRAFNMRLFGWCAMKFGSLPLAFEVNDRYPKQTLSLDRLQRMGAVLARSITEWLAADDGRHWHEARMQQLSNK
jgi:hypothetical protein